MVDGSDVGIVVNVRSLAAPLTGVQRYTSEVVARLGARVRTLAPSNGARGGRGHLWEQSVLPLQVRGSVLWSPANTGPLAVARQVVTIHDVSPLDHPEWQSAGFSRWYRFLLPRLARRAERVITDSAFSKERIVATIGVPDDKVEVIPIGVDPAFFPRGTQEIVRMREELGLAAGDYLLFVGSLEPRKNLGRLLEAWRLALPDLPDDLTLVVVGARDVAVFGSGSLGPLPPRVVPVGRVGDEWLPALYSGAVAFVYPALYEGFGLPPLEAMACGTPVLTSNRSSLPEVVGDAALTVDPTDVEALAHSLVRICSDDEMCSTLALRGRERAAGFRWEDTADRVWRVLQAVARSS